MPGTASTTELQRFVRMSVTSHGTDGNARLQANVARAIHGYNREDPNFEPPCKVETVYNRSITNFMLWIVLETSRNVAKMR